MTHKFCLKCGHKNVFENPPKFCWNCGHSFGMTTSISSKPDTKVKTRRPIFDDEDEDDNYEEESVSIDISKLKKDWVADISKNQQIGEKFKDCYAQAPDPNFRRTVREEFSPNEKAINVTRKECSKKNSSKSID